MTASFFGDFDVEDAWDNEPAEPGQVARKLHGYRILLEQLAGRTLVPYDDIGDDERDELVLVGRRVVAYVHTHDPDNIGLAEAIHGGDLDSLPEDHRRLAIAIAALISAWLLMEGAWR